MTMNDQYSSMAMPQQMLLHLLSIAMTRKSKENRFSQEDLHGMDWKAVYRESRKQTVCLMALHAVAEYRQYLPADVYNAWIGQAGDLFSRNLQISSEQQRMVELLTQNGIPHVILKGYAAAAYYPRADLRMFGDVDFLVEKPFLNKAEDILVQNGYRRWKMPHDCHTVFSKNGVRFEMHVETVGIPFGNVGKKVREFMRNGVSTRQIKMVEDQSLFVPNDLYHGLILLLHMQHHMLGEGMGLRHLCDWLLYVQKTAQQDFWDETLIPFLKEIGLYRFAATVTKLGAIYFDLPCPLWAQEIDENLCADVMNDILIGGNFGVKDKERAKSGMLISEHGKSGTERGTLYNLMHLMHRNVWQTYPILHKVPLLYPFLYVYRVLRHVVLMVFGKRVSLFKMIVPAKERRGIYRQLHVFETEKQG